MWHKRVRYETIPRRFACKHDMRDPQDVADVPRPKPQADSTATSTIHFVDDVATTKVAKAMESIWIARWICRDDEEKVLACSVQADSTVSMSMSALRSGGHRKVVGMRSTAPKKVGGGCFNPPKNGSIGLACGPEGNPWPKHPKFRQNQHGSRHNPSPRR